MTGPRAAEEIRNAQRRAFSFEFRPGLGAEPARIKGGVMILAGDGGFDARGAHAVRGHDRSRVFGARGRVADALDMAFVVVEQPHLCLRASHRAPGDG